MQARGAHMARQWAALVVAAAVLAAMAGPCVAQSHTPPPPSLNGQLTHGMITKVNTDENIEITPFQSAVNPKLRLYRSDQGVAPDEIHLYANETNLFLLTGSVCYLYDYEWVFTIDYYHKAVYRGDLEITTPYFSNITVHRFQGSAQDYGFDFDLYTKPDDPDFVVRKVNYAYGTVYGSLVDHSQYTFEQLPESYFAAPCRRKKRDAPADLPAGGSHAVSSEYARSVFKQHPEIVPAAGASEPAEARELGLVE